MDKTLRKDRIDKMIDTVMSVAKGDYSVQVELSGKNDELDSLAMGLNMMIDDLNTSTVALEYATSRIDEIINIIQRVARGDYSVGYELSEKNDLFDALGTGVNMMIDDIGTSYKELNALNIHLQASLEKTKTLSGLIPICAWCKKIRDDKGYWKAVETYVGERTKAEFTHGMCPECQNKYFTEYFTEENSKENNNSKVN